MLAQLFLTVFGIAASEPCLDYSTLHHWVGDLVLSGGGQGDIAIVGNMAYLAGGSGNKLYVIELADPKAPVVASEVEIPGAGAHQLAVSGGHAYITAEYAGVQIVDVRDMTQAQLVGVVTDVPMARGIDIDGDLLCVTDPVSAIAYFFSIDPSAAINYESQIALSWHPGSVVLSQGYAYVGDDFRGIDVVDVRNPAIPVRVGGLILSTAAKGMRLVGSKLYVADGRGLRIIDVADPSQPTLLGGLYLWGSTEDVEVIGDLAYVAGSDVGLSVVDVSDPMQPRNLNAGAFAAWEPYSIAVSESHAYVPTHEGVQIIQLGQPAQDSMFDRVQMPGDAFTHGIAALGDLAFVTHAPSDLKIFRTQIGTPSTLVGGLSTLTSPYGVCVVESTLYIADGAAGLRVVEFTDPQSPAIIASVAMPDAFEVDVTNNLAIVSGREEGVRIVDLSDRMSPELIGTVTPPLEARSSAVSGELVYVAAGLAGLCVVDVSDPGHPSTIACADFPGFQFADEVAVHESNAYVGADTELHVFDVGDLSAILHLTQLRVPDSIRGLAVSGLQLYVALLRGGIQVYDISNGDHPRLAGALELPTNFRDVVVADGSVHALASTALYTAAVHCESQPVSVAVRQFDVERAGAEVRISAELAGTLDPTGVRLSARQGHAEWDVGFELLHGATLLAHDRIQSAADHGTRWYRLSLLEADGEWVLAAERPIILGELDRRPMLLGLSPNPFNPRTTVQFLAPLGQNCTVSVLDARGRRVTTLFEGVGVGAPAALIWDASDLASGVYHILLESLAARQSRSAVLLR